MSMCNDDAVEVLRAALESGQAAPIQAALWLVDELPVGQRVEMAAYARGKVRERPELLKVWPLHVLGKEWKPLAHSLGQFSSPDAYREMGAGQCKLLGGAAHLPICASHLPDLPSSHHKGWDMLIWSEVRRALLRLVWELEMIAVLIPGKVGAEQISEHNAALFYPAQQAFVAWLDEVEGHIADDLPMKITARELARGSNPFRGLWDLQTAEGTLALNIGATIAPGAVAEGGSSLVALAGIFLRINSYSVSLMGPQNAFELWQDACRRLYCDAWASVGGMR